MLRVINEFTYAQRLEALRETKIKQTLEKLEVIGSTDMDDKGRILPPSEERELVEYVSSAGELTKDVIIKSFKPISNHPSGGFFGPKACGANFRRLLEIHPVYINPISSMAGGYMVNFMAYRNPFWKPEFDYSHLKEDQKRYGIMHGIGNVQHFCPDVTIGLKLGWGGLLEKVRHYRKINPHAADFYDGLEDVILGVQNWISRHVEAARKMAEKEENPQLRKNLEEIAEINEKLVTDPPQTFREACQWISWFQMVAAMYNVSGALGQLDEILRPYYERDVAAGILNDEEAIFHIACMLLTDEQYIQLGGPNAEGKDVTSKVSFLILEAVHRLKTPADIGIMVHDGLDPKLLRRGIEIMLEDKMGFPKFLGGEAVIKGFTRNGYSIELARQRVYSGCHWFAIPGREYTMNDAVKINFASVFDVALREMLSNTSVKPSVKLLWRLFKKHLKRAIEVTAKGIDFHLEHMHEVFPELVLDLFCYGPVEKGLDATHG
ncbi:MAG: pyruvate formate lyase family protein, partial [Candidatus Bathyarchaeia archaeon]